MIQDLSIKYTLKRSPVLFSNLGSRTIGIILKITRLSAFLYPYLLFSQPALSAKHVRDVSPASAGQETSTNSWIIDERHASLRLCATYNGTHYQHYIFSRGIYPQQW